MDDNTREVALGLITMLSAVLGAVVGIVLTARIQNQHRHDEERRRVFGHLVGLVRSEMLHHTSLRVAGKPRQAIPSESYLDGAAETVGLVEILSPQKLGELARELHNAVVGWVEDMPSGETEWQASYDALAGKVKDFIAWAKKEL